MPKVLADRWQNKEIVLRQSFRNRLMRDRPVGLDPDVIRQFRNELLRFFPIILLLMEL